MMHKAWCSIEEVPYYFSRSSNKFQGHTGWKINLDQIWARLLGRSQLSNPSDLPCPTVMGSRPFHCELNYCTTEYRRQWPSPTDFAIEKQLQNFPFFKKSSTVSILDNSSIVELIDGLRLMVSTSHAGVMSIEHLSGIICKELLPRIIKMDLVLCEIFIHLRAEITTTFFKFLSPGHIANIRVDHRDLLHHSLIMATWWDIINYNIRTGTTALNFPNLTVYLLDDLGRSTIVGDVVSTTLQYNSLWLVMREYATHTQGNCRCSIKYSPHEIVTPGWLFHIKYSPRGEYFTMKYSPLYENVTPWGWIFYDEIFTPGWIFYNEIFIPGLVNS